MCESRWELLRRVLCFAGSALVLQEIKGDLAWPSLATVPGLWVYEACAVFAGISWEASRGPLGGSFEASWGPFGGLLGPLLGLNGASWGPLGCFLVFLGRPLGPS